MIHDDTITEPAYDVKITRNVEGQGIACGKYRWQVMKAGETYDVAHGSGETKIGCRFAIRRAVKALEEPLVESYRLRKEAR